MPRRDMHTGPRTPRPVSRSRQGAAEASFSEGRAKVILGIFLILAALFLVRLVYLQVIVAGEYSEQAAQSRTVSIDIAPKRGTIYDRNGNVLATSIDAKTVYANPKDVTDASWEAEQIVSVLGGTKKEWEELLTQDTTFVYLKKQVEDETAQKLQDLALDGVYFLDDSKRIYPYGQVGGQIIGLIDVDGKGLTGLELYYDDILAGEAGTLTAQYYGDDGKTIPGSVSENKPAVDGEDIVISIDIGMQQRVEEVLSATQADLSSKGGNSIVYDGGTGEIYACASLPYLDPSKRDDVKAGSTELQSITAAFEPGSIFKTVTFAAIMEAGVLTPDDEVFCPAALAADEYYITDAHDRGDETLTVRQILDQSSNVGTSLCASKLGFPPLYDKIIEYNLNEATGVDFPGEGSGFLTDVSEWSTIQAYNVSFGQGISVTPLQITRFYGALVNDGVECTPHFLMQRLNSDEQPQWGTEQVIQNKAAIGTMTDMLTTVVEDGTGKDAAIEGYTVAGKTGTAEYASESGGYVKGSYNISFVGYLPNSNSQLVCFVGATEVPAERSTTSAFSDIMSFATERYRIVAE